LSYWFGLSPHAPWRGDPRFDADHPFGYRVTTKRVP
jgi:hypothetical protein